YINRGDLLIGMVKVLRDDLVAEGVPAGAYGVGYTSLAWTRQAMCNLSAMVSYRNMENSTCGMMTSCCTRRRMRHC
ncbi:MAG: hypothetical protein JJ992_10695, partial [Planctomycetes bacterium]|nr:hypothetical protein [Planctomycetota bacterium]